MKLPPEHFASAAATGAAATAGGHHHQHHLATKSGRGETFGRRMLERMGWSDGLGLGKDKNGMKSAIEVKKKDDARGVSRF